MTFSVDRMAAELRGLRGKKHVSQQEVADAVGVERVTIKNYENGLTVPSYETAWKLADYYGVSLDAIGGRP